MSGVRDATISLLGNAVFAGRSRRNDRAAVCIWGAGPALAELRYTTINKQYELCMAKQRAFDRDEKLSVVELSLLRAYRK